MYILIFILLIFSILLGVYWFYKFYNQNIPKKKLNVVLKKNIFDSESLNSFDSYVIDEKSSYSGNEIENYESNSENEEYLQSETKSENDNISFFENNLERDSLDIRSSENNDSDNDSNKESLENW